MEKQWSAIGRKATKNEMLTFYGEVVQCLEDVTNRKATLGMKKQQDFTQY